MGMYALVPKKRVYDVYQADHECQLSEGFGRLSHGYPPATARQSTFKVKRQRKLQLAAEFEERRAHVFEAPSSGLAERPARKENC